MKKTMKTMLAFMAGALCLTGCESEFSEQENLIEANNARFVTLTAYHEGEGATRAAIDVVGTPTHSQDAHILVKAEIQNVRIFLPECAKKITVLFYM